MSSHSKNPFVAALVGILLVPGSMALQAWNEYRTIHRTRGLNEAEEIVVPIDDVEVVNQELNGKLVHLAGEAITEQRLRDPIFGIEASAIQLRRVVEMYQWDEDKKTDDGKTRYSYKKVWREGRINSNQFERSSGHSNPRPAFESWHKIADQVMVGKHELNDSLKQQKDDYQPVAVEIDATRQALASKKKHAKEANRIVANGPQLFYAASALMETSSEQAGSGDTGRSNTELSNNESDLSKDPGDEGSLARSTTKTASIDPSSPDIGDLRIQFKMVPNGPVSLMAALKNDTFASYQTSNGEPIERLYPELLTAQQVVANMRSENSMIAWLLRGLGFVLCMVGMLMIFAPAQALFSWIPFVGDIAGIFMLVVSLAVAAILSLLTISISWIAVRPLFSLGLLAIACGIIYLLYQKKKSGNFPHRTGSNPDETIMVTDDMIIS